MLTPEEDFETWSTALTATADDIDEFSVFLPEISKLIDQISAHGKLDEPLTENTDYFIASLTEAITTIANTKETVEPENLEIALAFFKKIIDLVHYGFETLNISYIDFSFPLLVNRNNPFYTNNQSFDISALFSYVNDVGIFEDIYHIMKNDEISYDMYLKCYTIYVWIINFSEKYKQYPTLISIMKRLIFFMKKDKRLIDVNTISNIFSFLHNYGKNSLPIDPKFVDLLIDISILLVKTDIFDREKVGYNALHIFLSDKEYLEEASKHFTDLSILKKTNLHEQFMPYVGCILGDLAKVRKIDFETIREMWELRKVRHPTVMNYYLQIFIILAESAPSDFLVPLTELVKESDNIEFLNKFTHVLGKRGDAEEAFSLMRVYFMDLAFSDKATPEIMDILGKILYFHLSDDDFNKILSDFIQKDTKVLITVMKSIVLTKKMSEPVARMLIKRVADYISTNPGNNDAFEFIYGVINSNSLNLDEEILNQLFSLYKDPNFYFFASHLNNNNFLPPNYVEKFILSHKYELEGHQYIQFVKCYISKLNNNVMVYKELPFKGSDLIWELSLTEKNISGQFSNFLINNYIKNDGVELTDSKVLDVFIQDWKDRLTKENEEQMMSIMYLFISQFDLTVDEEKFGFVSHINSIIRNYKVEVNGKYLNSKFVTTVHPFTPIYIIMQRLSKFSQIDMSAFILTTDREKKVLPFSNIEKYLNNEKVASFNMEILPLNERHFVVHSRSLVAPLIIANSDISEIFFEAAQRGVSSAINLVGILPHNYDTVTKIKEINSMNITPEELFPLDNEFIFKYSIETITALITPQLKETLDEKGFINYLIDIVNNDANFGYTYHIITFISFIFSNAVEMKEKYSQKIFNTIFKQMRKYSNDTNKFDTFNGYIQSLTIPEFVTEFYDTFEDDLKFFLTNPNQMVRNGVLKIINQIKIPLSFFVSIIGEKLHEEFFIATIPHISNEYSNELFNAAYYEVAKNSKCTIQALNLLEEMLKTGKVPIEQEVKLCTILVQKFLTINGSYYETNEFEAAAGCLGKMKNKQLYDYLTELHNQKHFYTKWDIKGDEKVRTTYSGLVNMGCTCFFNSILQQLFAIPPLRKKIFEYQGDDMLMIELKLLFAKMMNSNKPSQNTAGVIDHFIGWDGEKMNPLIQQDACEFLQVFLDKLETTLGVSFIHSLFKGTTVNCIDGIDKEYHSERSEQFYTFQVPVKGYTNLNDSINSISTPDFLTGDNKYKAEEIGLIDAKKSTKVGEMPPYLIIQLTRFEYEYSTMTRTKIDSKLEFPEDLSLNGDYTLSGVIVHMGGAEFGHYISYVKDRINNVWYLCNDESVTEVSIDEVLQQSYGESSKSGYLLFYDKKDNVYDNNYAIEENITNKIIEKNKLNNEYRVLCSSGYFKLATEFSKREDPLFVEIALRYFFDTLPCTLFTEHASTIGKNLIKALNEEKIIKDVFIKEINQSNISTAILYSPSKIIRSNALEMIKSIDPTQITIRTACTLFNLLKHTPTFYESFNEYFAALNYIVSGNEDIRNYAIKFEWGTELVNMLGSIYPKIVQQNPNFYSVVDFSGIFELICNFEMPTIFVNYILRNNIIYKYICSKTKTDSMVKLYKAIQKEDKDFQIANLLEMVLVEENAELDKTVEFTFKYFGKEGFNIIERRLQMEQSAPNYRIVMAYCTMIEEANMRPFFIENIDKILTYLSDTDKNCRIAAENCIYLMNPRKEHKPVDEEVNALIRESLEDYAPFAYSFFNRSEEYLRLLQRIGSEAGSYLLDECDFPLFDERAKILFKSVKDVKNPLKFIVPYNFNVQLSTVLNFFEVLAPHLMKHETTEESTKVFLSNYAFISLSSASLPKYKPVCDYLIKCCKEQPDICKDYIVTKINEVTVINLSAVCIAAETLNIQLPLVDRLNIALKGPTLLSENELVEKCFAYDDGHFTELVPLLNNPSITGKARTLIWERIKSVPFDDFAQFYKGSDSDECAEYLKEHQTDSQEFNDLCKNVAIRSCESFAILSDFILTESIKEDIPFITTILTFDMKSDKQEEAITKLIQITGITFPVLRKIKINARIVSEMINKGTEGQSEEEKKEIVENLIRYIRVYKATMNDEEVNAKLETIRNSLKELNTDYYGLLQAVQE